MRARVLLLLVGLGAGLIPLAAQAAPVECAASPCVVRVVNGRYDPSHIRIPIGATVQWLVQENGHTVSASDYRFDWEPDRTLRTGETRTWRFTEDETVRYACRIHAPGMSGIVTVGDGSPPPPPPPVITGESRVVPSPAYPTIASAMIAIPEDSEIVLSPGTYPPFVVTVDDVLIRSASTPDEVIVDGSVVIDGGGISKAGITIRGDRVRVRGIQVIKVADDGIVVDGTDTRLSHVVIQSGLRSAIRGTPERLVIEDATITGSIASSGILLEGGHDVLIQRTTVSAARTGVLATGTDGIVVRGSTLAGSGTGIAVRSSSQDRVIGGHLFANTITRTNGPTLGLAADDVPVVGAGVWLDGTAGVRVERNEIRDSMTYAIAVTGLNGPTVDVTVRDTEASGSRIADLGWDGLGTACLEHAGTTDPPVLLPCGASPHLGAPYPKVAAELYAYAALGPLL